MAEEKASPSFDLCTQFVTAGRQHTGYLGSVNPPIYRTSTLVYPDFKTLKEGLTIFGHWTDYSRTGSPSSFLLQDALCEIQPGACCALPTPSGLCAISTALLALLQAGDHLLVTDSVYGPVRQFCEGMLKKNGIIVQYYDPLIGAQIEELVKDTTRVIYMEQPGSLTFEIQDIAAIVQVAQKRGIATIVDSTWATPLFYNALDHGVDVVVQSLSKYISGHADIMMGALTIGNPTLAETIKSVYKSLGLCVSPDDIYLVKRGLRTLAVRMRHHMEAGLTFARWLQTCPLVERVIHPGLEGDAGYPLWKKYFKGASSLFAVLLKPCSEEALAAMVNGFSLFAMGQSWGGFESLIYPIITPIPRQIKPWTGQGYLLRLHIGLEALDDLKEDFSQGLARLSSAMAQNEAGYSLQSKDVQTHVEL